MRFRNSRLRTKVTALLLSLAALWTFAAWVTLREGINLLWVTTLNDGVAQPIDTLLTDLQKERKLTVVRLADRRISPATLKAQRDSTDRSAATFLRLAAGGDVKRAASPTLRNHLDQVFDELAHLADDREAADKGLVDREQAALPYTRTIKSIFLVYDSLATLDDKEFAKDTRVLIELNQAREMISQEDALFSGALRAPRLAREDYVDFVQLIGIERYLSDRAMADLQSFDRTAYNQIIGNDPLRRLRAMEDTIVQRGRPGTRPPFTAADWETVAEGTLTQFQQNIFSAGDRLVERAQPIAIGVVVRLILAGGLGLVAVITSIILSITTARALVRQLERLRAAAWKLADERLPSVVERLGHGEKVDVAAEAPRLEFGSDEIGQVGQAFNAVQQTAIRVAVEQAELRRGIRDILLSLARRSQALIHRQLALLDAMERREMDTEELEDLFRVDHLATRMRRNAENLIVLSGATPARGWRRAVSMMDVVRSAVAEVEDYTRVTVLPMDEVGLTGRAVGDVSHLIAELIENAVSFSPPYTMAQVSGHLTASGYAVEIEDRGLGMTDENLAAINDRIAHPPEFNLSSSAQLGLYVVGRLAERYGIRVCLKRSPYGGTTAVVLVPSDLLMEQGQAESGSRELPADGHETSVAAIGAGQHGAEHAGRQDGGFSTAQTQGGDTGRSGGHEGVADPRSEAGQDVRPDAGPGGPVLSAVPRPDPARRAPADAAGGPAGAAGAAGVRPVLPARTTGPMPAVPAPGQPGQPGRFGTGGHDLARGTGGLSGTASGPGRGTVPSGAPHAAPTGDGAASNDDLNDGSQRPVPEMSHTPSGLPFRVPQASLAPPLRDEGTASGEGSAPDDDEVRSPDELREMLGAYQQATLRGRSDGARHRDGDAHGDAASPRPRPPSAPPEAHSADTGDTRE